MENIFKENTEHINTNYRPINGSEKFLFLEVLKLLPDTGQFIEVGSRDGRDHSLTLTNKGWSGHCIEANPEIANHTLYNNFRNNSRVKTHNYFVSDKTGSTEFYIETTVNSGVSSAFYERATGIDSGIHRTVRKPILVPTISLNQFVEENCHSACDLLMTDTEGYDAKILFSTDFSKFRPKTIMSETAFCYYHEEPHLKQNAASIYVDLLRHMSNNGYKVILSNNEVGYKQRYCPELMDIPMNTVWALDDTDI